MSIQASELQSYLKTLEIEVAQHHLSHPILYASNALYFHLSGEKHRLAIVLDDSDPRLYAAKDSVDVPSLDSHFLDQFKKELGNAYLEKVEQINGDRVLRLDLSIINSVYKEESRYLYFEMIPHHANLIYTDVNNTVIAAFRPGEMSDERPLLKGLTYEAPKKNDFLPSKQAFDPVAYLSDCFRKEQLLDEKRKKDRFGYLFDSLHKREKLLKRKLIYLDNDRQEALLHVDDNLKGDAIYVSYSSLNNRMGSFDYEGLKVDLDPAKSLSKNAETYYKRSKKAKETLALNAQMKAATEKELLDVTSALAQLKAASEEGLEALSKELGIVPQAPAKKKKDKEWRGLSHDSLPYFVTYHGTKILFGKSAKQNDCLSFLLDTAKEHYWLHVMGNTGSHVMIKKENPSEEEIHFAAEIALANSSLDEGEVMLTKRENVRKGPVMGMAIVKVFRTLRLTKVDPEVKVLLQNAEKVSL
jgi:predicted ribosome quality control (RQC) complex YloA/Tae2 family protein